MVIAWHNRGSEYRFYPLLSARPRNNDSKSYRASLLRRRQGGGGGAVATPPTEEVVVGSSEDKREVTQRVQRDRNIHLQRF